MRFTLLVVMLSTDVEIMKVCVFVCDMQDILYLDVIFV